MTCPTLRQTQQRLAVVVFWEKKYVVQQPPQHVSRRPSVKRREIPAVYGKAAQADAFAALQNFLQKRFLI